MESITQQFLRGDYMPHGHCYLWQPHILWTHVLSDLLIATAYFSIPIAILIFMNKRKDIGYNNVFLLFSLFILFCGITHLFGIWTIWQGVYGYHGIAKAFTAIVSTITAFYLYKLLPDLLRVPTIEQYEGIKSQFGDSKQENAKLSGLLEGHNQTKWMLNSIPISLILANDKGEVEFVNEKFEQEFGQSQPKVSDFLHSHSAEFEHLLESNAQELELDQSTIFVGHITSAGKSQNVEVTLTKKKYDEQIQLLLTLKDLKEVSSLKKQLVDSNARFERAIGATKDGIWDWNLSTGDLVWSPKLFELIGLSKDQEPTFDIWFEHVHPSHKDMVHNAVTGHLEKGEKYEVEYLGRNSNGEFGWFLTRGDSIYNDKGEPVNMSGSLRYIEEEKQAKNLLDERTRFLEALYMGANHAIWVIEHEDNDFRFSTYNDTALSWTGISKEQIIGKKLSEIEAFPREVKTHIFEKYQSCIDSNKPVEYVECIPLDSEPRWYQTSLYPIADNQLKQNKFIIGTAVDITKQKQVEEELSQSYLFLENLLDSSVCGFYIFNLVTMQNERINQTYTDILGYTIEDLQSDSDLMAKFHPDEQAAVVEHMQAVANSKENEKHPLEYRFKHKNGAWVWCYSVDSILERDEQGNPIKMLGTFVDVSDKNALLLKLKESNDYLEQFAFVASHDLQEPLRKISAFSDSIYQRLKGQFESDPDSEFELTRLRLAATRLSKMIEDLLKLSRINSSSLTLENISTQQLVTSVVEPLELLIDKSKAVIEVQGGDVILAVDVGLFGQALQNLIGNALKFHQDGISPRVIVSASSFANGIELIVEDNGIGIDGRHLDRIFEPFKRLHSREKYEGSGIGLAIVARIVKVHNAAITCESEEGKGTRFVIRIPN